MFDTLSQFSRVARVAVLALLVTMSCSPTRAGVLAGDMFRDGDAVQTFQGVEPGIDAIASAEGGAAKFRRAGAAEAGGVGIAGGNSDEIEVGEGILVQFTAALRIASLRLSRLFDGPEFGVSHETAEIRATLGNGRSLIGQLIAEGETEARWSLGGLARNLSPASARGNAVWEIVDPFGGLAVTSILFGAAPGQPMQACVGACPGDSDYQLARLETQAADVAEPSAMAVLGAALLGLAMLLRRRRGRTWFRQ